MTDREDQPTRWTSRTTLAIAATMGGQAFGAAAQLAPAVLALEIAAAAGVAPTMIGVYAGIVFFAAAVSSLGGGGLIARHGGVRAVQVGVVLSAIGVALAALGHPAALAASAFVIGLGYGPMTPASSVVLAHWAPAHRLGLVMSIKQTGVPLGYFATGVLLPWLAATVGWQNAMLALAGAAVVTALLLGPAAKRLDQRSRSVTGGFASAKRSLGLLKRHPKLMRIAMASLAFAGVQVAVTSFLVVYLESEAGLPKSLAAWPLAVAGVAAVAGRIGWGALADLAPAARLLAILPILMASALVFLLMVGPNADIILLTGLGLALGLSVLAWNGVMLIEAARQAPPGEIGLATSGVLALTYIGSTIFPQLLSLTVGALGSYAIGFGAMIGAALLVAIVYMPDAIKKS